MQSGLPADADSLRETGSVFTGIHRVGPCPIAAVSVLSHYKALADGADPLVPSVPEASVAVLTQSTPLLPPPHPQSSLPCITC